MNKTIKYFEDLITHLNLDHGNINSIEHFDDRKFRFGVYLVNQDNRAVKIRKGSIDELVITDDLTEWFHHGHLTFLNPDDVLERAQTRIQNDGENLNATIKTLPYRFRGDGRDLLYIHMEPYIQDDDQPNEKLDSIVHTVKFLFSVYAIEDILDTRGKRYKKQKLYFHDYRKQQLRERTTFYSTAKHILANGISDQKKDDLTQRTNLDRSKYTGEILQDLLLSTLVESDTDNLISSNWEFGENKLFYTSPCEFKAYDDISYILDRHVSSSTYSNEPCILKLQRMTERWELLPISEYFNRSTNKRGPGAYQDEHFLISFDSEAEGGSTIPPERKTFGKSERSGMINYHYPDLSVIDDYTFSEINGVDCQELLNSKIVHRYNEGDKLFSVDISSGNIKTVHNDFQSLYISKTYGGENNSGFTSWLTDSTREKNLNVTVESSWSPDKTLSLTVGRNKTLLSALLLGNTISFNTRGTTSRRSGVFIAIDRDNNYIDSEYEEKVLGQYFVTKVTHRITSTGEYENNVIAVKPYTYRNQRFDTSDIFFKDPENIKY